MIISLENLYYKRYCTYILGYYVQVNNVVTPTNTNKARIINYIYFRLSEYVKDRYDLLHLATNMVVICIKIIPFPIKESVIRKVHNIKK